MSINHSFVMFTTKERLLKLIWNYNFLENSKWQRERLIVFQVIHSNIFNQILKNIALNVVMFMSML